jgi:hypothetical protein
VSYLFIYSSKKLSHLDRAENKSKWLGLKIGSLQNLPNIKWQSTKKKPRHHSPPHSITPTTTVLGVPHEELITWPRNFFERARAVVPPISLREGFFTSWCLGVIIWAHIEPRLSIGMTSQDKTSEARETGWSKRQQTSGVSKRDHLFISSKTL